MTILCTSKLAWDIIHIHVWHSVTSCVTDTMQNHFIHLANTGCHPYKLLSLCLAWACMLVTNCGMRAAHALWAWCTLAISYLGHDACLPSVTLKKHDICCACSRVHKITSSHPAPTMQGCQHILQEPYCLHQQGLCNVHALFICTKSTVHGHCMKGCRGYAQGDPAVSRWGQQLSLASWHWKGMCAWSPLQEAHLRNSLDSCWCFYHLAGTPLLAWLPYSTSAPLLLGCNESAPRLRMWANVTPDSLESGVLCIHSTCTALNMLHICPWIACVGF